MAKINLDKQSQPDETLPPPPPPAAAAEAAQPPPIPEERDDVVVPPPPPARSYWREKEERERKERRKKIFSAGWGNLGPGIGMLAFGLWGVSWPDIKPVLIVAGAVMLPMLLVTYFIERARVTKKWDRLGGWKEALWRKVQGIWSNHGGGFYGLVTIMYVFRMKMSNLIEGWPPKAMTFQDIFYWFFVDRFMDFWPEIWKAFIWPVSWIGYMGVFAGIGLMLTGFGLYEWVRLAAGSDIVEEDEFSQEINDALNGL